MTKQREPTRSCAWPLLAGALVLAACGKSEPPTGSLKENVERTVGAPKESTGVLGGNDAPADAGTTGTAVEDAGCGMEGRACGAPASGNGASDGG